MKIIIAFKKFDLFIQAQFLIGLGITISAGSGSEDVLLLLAGWQLTSALLHTVFHFSYPSIHRKYAYQLAIFILTAFFAAYLFFIFYILLLVFWGVMALMLYYIYVCCDELRILNKKSVVHLK